MTHPEGLLIAGEVGKPHGISGEVYVVRISDDPARFEPGAELVHEHGTLTVESSRPHGNRFLVKFSGVDSRDDAERLRGALYVAAAKKRPLDEGEYWEHDLVGCRVLLPGGNVVGRVQRILKHPAQDLLEIETPSGSALVPLVKEIVISVDVTERAIVIDPPAGLVEGS